MSNKMTRVIGMITLLVFSFFVFGCYSVPEVDKYSEPKVKRFRYDDNEKRYDVVIDRDYVSDPVKIKYAINSFVKEVGGTSYDVLKHGENDYYVTIPGKTPVENVKGYDVQIDRDYISDPVKLKYALNSFVKDQDGTSYDALKHGENNYYVTIPGKTPVEDLPKVKHFQKGKTVAAIAIPTGGALLLLLIFLSPAFQQDSRNK